MKTRTLLARCGLAMAIAVACSFLAQSARSQDKSDSSPILGRWDLVCRDPGGTFPSWLDIQRSGHKTLVGYFVGRGGSVRPISQIHFKDGRVKFQLPVQWEEGPEDFRFEGTLADGKLSGAFLDDKNNKLTWTGVRAPELKREKAPAWGQEIALFNGQDLSGWKGRWSDRKQGWVVEDGMLKNAKPGNDLITERKFNDFKLHAEFRYPKGSNSGIYLRGRYEAQIEDNYGRRPDSHLIGGIYGFLTPRIMAAKPGGEWQTFALTLVGRHVSATLNGEPVIVQQEIPGITGGAMDSNEGESGPVMLQGDHGKIDFRKLTITPSLVYP